MIRSIIDLKFLNPPHLIRSGLSRLWICRGCAKAGVRRTLWALMAGGLVFSLPAVAEDGYTLAERLVKTQPCTAEQTVDEYFAQQLSHTHRDLGWRVIAVDEGFYVERVFMVSKSAELRYRWFVGGGATPSPVNERAQNLCS
ncbi:MAG: hypothetical protein PHW13_12180 [Methylococcales bacterium]|nr:hypothetical protein [Methylococcales bacterium]